MAVNFDLEWAVEDVRARQAPYALAVAYDLGNHRLTFATEKFRNAFGDMFREFADNLCDDVLDGISDRLQVLGWSSTDDNLAKAADDVWTRMKGEARTGAVHRNGFREGDGFGIVQVGPDQRSRLHKQNPATMAVRWSSENPDEPELFAKVWKDTSLKRYRVNLYYLGRTEKYASRGLGHDGGLPRAAAFRLLEPGDPGLQGDEEGLNEHGDARHVVYHFPNGEPGMYGRSLLNGVIPLQDALNKAIADMLVAMEFHAYPQRWATGVQVERDPITGAEINPFKSGESRLWRTGSKEAAFGQFSPADLVGFLEVQDAFKLEAARKGALPPHAITTRKGASAAPTGISMLVAEGKTIKMARDRMRDWGPEHQAWMAHCLSLDLGTDVKPDDLELEWAPPETRDEKALLETLALKHDLGVPLNQILLEMGYTQDQVDDFLEEVAAEDADAVAAMSVLQGRQPGAQMNRGQARTLGLPSAPVPPGGATTPLAS